jgi:hypothetical protein
MIGFLPIGEITMTIHSHPPLFNFEHREKGQSLLEMAFAIIVLLVLLAGIIDLGRLFFTYIALRDAAQEGAAFASICPPDPTLPGNGVRIRDHVKSSSHFPVDLSAGNIMVGSGFVAGESAAPGSQVYVTVTYFNFQFIVPFISIFVDGNFSATAHDVSLQYECPP